MFLNHTEHYRKKQQPDKKVLLGHDAQVGNISGWIKDNPVDYFSNILDTQHRTLRVLLEEATQRGPVFQMSSYDIAARAGIHFSQVDKSFREFKKQGLVATHYSTKTGKIIALNNFFFDSEIKELLSPIFKCMRYLSIFLLVSLASLQSSSYLQQRNGLSYKRKNNIYINNYIHIGGARAVLRGSKDVIQLTATGETILTAYPASALQHAVNVARGKRRIRNMFGYVVRCAENFCKENGLKKLWKYVFDRKASLEIGSHNPVVLDKEASLRAAFDDWEETQPWKVGKSDNRPQPTQVTSGPVGKSSIRDQVKSMAKPGVRPSGPRVHHDPLLAAYQAQQRAKYAIKPMVDLPDETGYDDVGS